MQSFERPQKVAEENRLAQIVHAVAILPFNPDVLQGEISAVSDGLHHLHNTRKIDRIIAKRCLYRAVSCAAYMEMAGVSDQGFDLRVGHANSREMAVVERVGQPRNRLNQSQR